VANSADGDPSPNVQLELQLVSERFKGRDLPSLLSDPAFREWVGGLWNRHQSLLVELAHYHLHDWDRAEEVVQDAWVDFIESIPRFQGQCSEKTWLVQILRRCIQKEKRRTVFTRAREAIFAVFERGRGEGYGASAVPRPSWYESPEQMLLAQERLEQVWRARRALPKRQAEVWILRDVLEWTPEEVSAALGLKPENERVLRHRARRRLKKELQHYFGEAKKVRPRRSETHDVQQS
jgi:RNA polymerase sigma-70 factor, ECF subfamily